MAQVIPFPATRVYRSQELSRAINDLLECERWIMEQSDTDIAYVRREVALASLDHLEERVARLGGIPKAMLKRDGIDVVAADGTLWTKM